MATRAKIDLLINDFNAETKLQGMNKRLKEMKSALQDVDGDEFQHLANAINDAEGKIGSINDRFNTLRGSGIERTNASLGLMREGLNNLDFDKITDGAKSLTSVLGAGGLVGIVAVAISSMIDWNKVTAEGTKIWNGFTDAIGATDHATVEFYRKSIEASKQLQTQYQNEMEIYQARMTFDANYTQLYIDSVGAQVAEINKQQYALEKINRTLSEGKGWEKNADEITKNLAEIEKLDKQIKSLNLTLETRTTQSLTNFGNVVSEINLKLQTLNASDVFEGNIIQMNASIEKQKKNLTDAFLRIDESLRKEGTEIYKNYHKALNELDGIRTIEYKKQIDARKKYLEELYGKDIRLTQIAPDTNAFLGPKPVQEPTVTPIGQTTAGMNNVQIGLAAGLTYQKSLQAQYEEWYKKNIDDYTTYTQSIKTLATDLNNFLNVQDQQRLQNLQYQNQLQIQSNNQKYNADLQNLNSYYQSQLNNDSLSASQRLKLLDELSYEQQMIEYNRQVAEQKIRKEALIEQNKISEQQFNRNKALQLANTTVNTASAVMKAAAEENYAAAIALGTLGVAQIGIIASTKFNPQRDASTQSAISVPQKPNTNYIAGGGSGNAQGYYNLQSQNYGNTDDGGIKEPIYVSVEEINKVNKRVQAVENRMRF